VSRASGKPPAHRTSNDANDNDLTPLPLTMAVDWLWCQLGDSASHRPLGRLRSR